jgi:hypothetical protein
MGRLCKAQEPAYNPVKNRINAKKKQAQYCGHDQHEDRRADGLWPSWPDDLVGLSLDLIHEFAWIDFCHA